MPVEILSLREGASVRGMEVEEGDARASEIMAPELRNLILRSGDQHLIKFIQSFPEESWSRLGKFYEQSKKGANV